MWHYRVCIKLQQQQKTEALLMTNSPQRLSQITWAHVNILLADNTTNAHNRKLASTAIDQPSTFLVACDSEARYDGSAPTLLPWGRAAIFLPEEAIADVSRRQEITQWDILFTWLRGPIVWYKSRGETSVMQPRTSAIYTVHTLIRVGHDVIAVVFICVYISFGNVEECLQ